MLLKTLDLTVISLFILFLLFNFFIYPIPPILIGKKNSIRATNRDQSPSPMMMWDAKNFYAE
jgi:hypothetical protein